MRLWENHKEGALRCLLCPHNCLIEPGGKGICGVRANIDGKILLLTRDYISGYALDPIEKKPLYHFFPGSSILSVGSFGCNLKCDFCQNYHISQDVVGEGARRLPPEQIVRQASMAGDNIGIAYTYNEPLISFEFVISCAMLAAREKLYNVMVTNGYISPGPLHELTGLIDAFNIDLKGFSNEFYRRYTGATLRPVLEAIKSVASSGRHLEITTLIIPGLNDSHDDMRREAEWISENAGREVPLHLSRYFPSYRRDTPATPPGTLTELREIAMEYLDYVYTGNLSLHESGSDTSCPSCHTVVIRRSGYIVHVTGLTDNGACRSCGRQIIAENLI
jgi:pyruvate formate lyase activating enzyme